MTRAPETRGGNSQVEEGASATAIGSQGARAHWYVSFSVSLSFYSYIPG